MSGAMVKTEKVHAMVEMLEARKEVIQAACMKGLDAGTLINLARAVVSRSPELADCTPVSLLQSVMFAAEHGLRLGALGHLYIVPFKGEAVPIIGYRGLIELAMRDGKVSKIEARLVYREDEFSIELGTNSDIHHLPDWDGPREDGDCTGAYCVVTMADGAQVFDYMTVKELNKIEKVSKTQKVWGPYKAEMRRKTITRRTLKYVPVGLALAVAQTAEDAHSGAIDVDAIIEDVASVPSKATGTDAVVAKVAQQVATADAEAAKGGEKTPSKRRRRTVKEAPKDVAGDAEKGEADPSLTMEAAEDDGNEGAGTAEIVDNDPFG